LLACIGIYGVMAYSVSQRTREMGIRLALGAMARDVTRLVVGDGLKLVLFGLVLGAIGATFATRLLQNQLYDVNRHDPATYIAVALALLMVSSAACFLPARRAARLDPTVALRSE
jgi:putative ABC transport system permease protein